MTSYPNIAQRVFNTPLLIHEGKLVAGLAAIGQRIVGGPVQLANAAEPLQHMAFDNGRPSLGVLDKSLQRDLDRRGRLPFDMIGSVAVVGIEGTLVYKGKHIGLSSGETSYEGLQVQIQKAKSLPQVRGVAFEVDSGGGEAAGAFETADMLFDLSQSKPTIAILTDFAASGAYLLASACRQIIMPRTGVAGSIGAVSVHMEMSRAMDAAGVTATVLRAGDRKMQGNQIEPLAPEMAAQWLQELSDMRQIFAEAVGRYRGTRFSVDAALKTEAATFSGTEAVALGMADATGHAGEAFSAFLAAINSGSGL